MANLNTGLSAEQVLEAFDRALHDMTDTQVQELVSNSIGALDVSSKGGSGKYIKSISESDGKIDATAETMDTEPTSGSDKAITSGAVFSALQGIFGPGTQLLVNGAPPDTDNHYNLDTLRTPGYYNTGAAGPVAYIDGKPNDTDITAVRADIVVLGFYGSRTLQVWIPNRTTNSQAFAELYIRSYGTSWSAWRGIYGTQL